jgi:hypothetical protein
MMETMCRVMDVTVNVNWSRFGNVTQREIKDRASAISSDRLSLWESKVRFISLGSTFILTET